MSIVSLPLTNQLTNGTTADGGQALADLNAIASQVNANAAANGVNGDITQLTNLQSINSGVSVSGWNVASSAITGSSITGCSIDSTTTAVTQPQGTNNNTVATMAALAAQSFSSALPAISISVKNQLVSNNGSSGLWTNQIATTNVFADSNDPTKTLQFNLSAVSSGSAVTITVPAGVTSINLASTPDFLLQAQGVI